MARWLDEVNAGMDTVVDDIHAVDLVLGFEISVESLLDVLNNRSPGIIVVNEVAKTGCVNDGQSEPHAILFDIRTD